MQVPGCVHKQGFIKNTVLLGVEKLKFCKLYGKSWAERPHVVLPAALKRSE